MENSSQFDSRGKSGQMVEVSEDESTVCCRGADEGLGHPAVYLTFSDRDTVRCYYCGCEFRRVKHGVKSPENK